jgi:hypothetical protein
MRHYTHHMSALWGVNMLWWVATAILIAIGVIGWIGRDAYIHRCRQCQTEYEGQSCPSCGSAPYRGRPGVHSEQP